MGTRSLYYASVCTGGAGLELGLDLVLGRSVRPVVYVEGEAFAVARLVTAFETQCLVAAPIWTDVRTFDGRAWRGALDGLIGGIPCQPHSVAGRMRGEHDERDLWPAARRIFVQSRPWWVFVENVGGMLSTGGAERIWRDLGRLGFAVEIGLFSALEVGAPHERERVFFLGVADAELGRVQRGRDARNMACEAGTAEIEGHQWQRGGDAARDSGPNVANPAATRFPLGLCQRDDPEREPATAERDRSQLAVPDNDGRPRRSGPPGHLDRRAEPAHRGRDLGHAVDRWELEPHRGRAEVGQRPEDASGRPLFPPRPDDLGQWRDVLERWPHLKPAVRRVVDGMAGRLDRIRMLGNGAVPLVAAHAFRTLANRLAARSPGAAILVRLMESL